MIRLAQSLWLCRCALWHRAVLWACCGVLAVAASGASAQTVDGQDAATVFVSLMVRQHALPRAAAFEEATARLVQAVAQRCEQRASNAAVWAQWREVLQAWQSLATPVWGPLLSRRSAMRVDFAPARPALIERAVQASPEHPEALEAVGAPAKGLAALEYLLQQELQGAHCQYARVLAQDMASEAQALHRAFAELQPEVPTMQAHALYAEWVNQWLGALERLRWSGIEQPLQRIQQATASAATAFRRRNDHDNVLEWQAQWAALRALAQNSSDGQAASASQSGAVTIEALLRQRGHSTLAQRWVGAVRQADAAMARLGNRIDTTKLWVVARALKALSVLYQEEVAAALGVALGFSDADGD